MQGHRRWLRPLGVVLLLPLAGALVRSMAFGATCDYDCGDQGGRGLFVLVLLCTPPGAVGLLLLTGTTRRRVAWPARWLVVAPVVLCTLVLVGSAIAAGVQGVDLLAGGGDFHRLGGPTAYDRDRAHRAGVLWLVIAAVLGALAITAALALWAAWRKRARRASTG